MSDDLTTGVLDPSRPGRWLVLPWPTRASFSDVVGHFLRHDPQRDNPSTAQLLAYFEAYGTALETAPFDKPAHAFQLRWCEDMRTCLARCTRLHGRNSLPRPEVCAAV